MTLLMSMVSCTEDFTDWAHPQTNPEEKAVAFGDGSVTPVGVINLADVKTETVKVASIEAPKSSNAAYTPTYKINFDGQSFDIDADGNMATADLANYIVEKYGKRPTRRDIDATLGQPLRLRWQHLLHSRLVPFLWLRLSKRAITS